MLRGNLATRPFYNERIVTLLLALIGAVVLALTVTNATRLMQLSSRRSELRAQINPQLERAARKRSKCDAVVDGVVDADVRRSRPLRFHGISGAL